MGAGPDSACRQNTLSSDSREGSGIEVLFERVAGLNSGRATLTGCLRSAG